MGMFDTVHMSENVFKKFWAYKGAMDFQTKDLDNTMSDYMVSDEGRLLKGIYRKKKFTAKQIKDNPLTVAFGRTFDWCMKRTGWKDTNFHGIINIYTNHNETGKWHEFQLKFTDGLLVSIKKTKFRA